jgi:nucleotide-binding universal stress UspA family protein
VELISKDNEAAVVRRSVIEETAELRGTDCEVIILPGKERDEILNFIEEGAVELIVMGAYGHKRWREFLLGSTTTHIINKSPIPVLLTH